MKTVTGTEVDNKMKIATLADNKMRTGTRTGSGSRIIAGHEFLPGKTTKDHIHVNGTELKVPHIMLCGSRPGPTLLVTAGIHNAEFVGIQAAVELSREIDTAELSGSLIIVPLANRSGFENRTMSLVHEDGKNLNRVFPGDADGTAADRLAHMLFSTFIVHADAYIDLHSGDGYEELTPYVYYLGSTPAEEVSRAMADCVDTAYTVRSRCWTGGAYNLASVNGIPSVLIERGCLSLYTREEVDADKRDVRNIMRLLGMLEGAAQSFCKAELTEHDYDAPSTGCWYPRLHAGDSFVKGSSLGEIRNYFGDLVNEIVADEDGIILHQCASLNIIEGDPMIAYGVHQE